LYFKNIIENNTKKKKKKKNRKTDIVFRLYSVEETKQVKTGLTISLGGEAAP